MTICIGFRGVMLYRWRPNVLSVLIPDGETPRMTRHPDGTPARPHFARLYVEGAHERAFDLLGTVVTATGDGTLSHTGDRPIPFKDILPPGSVPHHEEPHQATSRGFLACRVDLVGGATTVLEPSKHDWDLNEHLHPHGRSPVSAPALSIVWDSGLPALDLRINPGPVIQLKTTDTKVTIGNLDTPFPDEWDLLPEHLDPTKPVEDIDFKWLYQLYSPAVLSNLGNTVTGKSRRLPCPTRGRIPATDAAPTVQIAGVPMIPPVSTCFGGEG